MDTPSSSSRISSKANEVQVMKIHNVGKYLKDNNYPGRGIILGQTETSAVMAYFIMGRSENSRNRIFVEKEKGIITQAHDESKLVDPSLIIYAPVRIAENGSTVVTNGDQTDTVIEYLNQGKSFEEALRTRTFEPDAPNFTPRISGLMNVEDNKVTYKLSILKSIEGSEEGVQRFFYEYDSTVNGTGHIIHTYEQDGDPIPSFCGEPVKIDLYNQIDELTEVLWQNLNSENKVSLFVRYIDKQSGTVSTRICNKNQGEV